MEEFGNIWKQKACLFVGYTIEGSDYGNKGAEFL